MKVLQIERHVPDKGRGRQWTYFCCIPDYEIIRQIGILEMGGEVVNETRSFDVETSETVPMRDKEVKQDYRFMPEPNLPPLRLYHSIDLAKTDPDIWKSKIIIDDLERSMPTLPRDKKQQLMDRYGISLYQATFIVGENLEGVYEELVVGRDAARFTQFFISEFISKLRALDLTWDIAVPSTRIGELFDLRDVNKVSPTNGQWVLKAMLTDPEVRPAEWVESRGLWQITDIDVLTRACRTAIEDNPNAARKYLRGKARGMATLMGAARRGTENRADSLTLNRMLRQMLADKAEEGGNDADSKGK
ncbi:GATB-like protein [Mya arenaria]|uniref:GATB-like protein n=1 Tax=Mya arenaria TaxID=6604 RepID=A0ABY7FSN7_MYAAR|nr:GATB-like protein [Mya arenaria]